MNEDLKIARSVELNRVVEVADKHLGLSDEYLEPYGHYKAKISLDYLNSLPPREGSKLILVTAISPTPAGEGKTTTSVGLHDALCRLGRRSLVCLREPSLGPCFGMKGGAAGGGRAQVVPMEDINLHFTGDFHAIGLANNLLAAMIDNHVHQGNDLRIDLRRIQWRRVVDMNDRALREITVGLGGYGNGFPRSEGFDIVVASEVMAILCLSRSLAELKESLGNIMIGYSRNREPIYARQLNAHGPMAVLLKDAMKPNLVQTLEGNPALIHGGPFANIAHGCNSVIATEAGLKLADYVVTEAGFGADLGAEKFINIKCRKAGLMPDVVVIVATVRALKFHGGAKLDDLTTPDLGRLEAGLDNLERHIHNMRTNFGLPCVVAINRFTSDSEEEIALLERQLAHHQVPVAMSDHWARGGEGAEGLANEVMATLEKVPGNGKLLYADELSLEAKIDRVVKKIYHGSQCSIDAGVRRQLRNFENLGYGHLPVCVAKTPYSFSTNPKNLGAPEGHVVHVREVRLAAGAGFVVVICGDVMTMPGLPKVPAAERIDLDENGEIVGLF